MTTKIYGASDDLIEIDGDIRDEIGMYDTSEERPCWLNLSDGTKMKVFYDKEGVWRTVIVKEGDLFDHVDRSQADPDSDNYTEYAIFKDGLTHFFLGEEVETMTLYGSKDYLKRCIEAIEDHGEGMVKIIKDW